MQCDIISDVILILDTDVLVAAVRSPKGASAELLRLLQAGRVQVAASVALFVEYEATCTRAEHLLAGGWQQQDVLDLLDRLAALVTHTEIHYMWRPQVRDAADDMVLEAAVNARADAIVTFNTQDFGDAPMRFGIEVLLARDALARIALIHERS
jgi:putative PIN family toxin of toxin-antitoxin system